MYNQKYHQFLTFYNHKFGFHINGPSQQIFEAVLKLKPRLVKTLDFSVDAMKQIREQIPDVFLIGRLFVHPQDFGNFEGQSEPLSSRIKRARKKGQEMADKILRLEINKEIHYLNGNPVFNAWESLNELFNDRTDTDTQKLYDEYQVAFGEKLLAAGFEPIGMNFATGNFTGKQFVDNFPGTLDTYKYLGFHEYDWPTMDRLHKIGLAEPNTPAKIKERISYVGQGQGNDGLWLCLRYRRILFDGVRQKYGNKHVGIITECGMTQGVQGGHDIGPWATENTIPGSSVPVPISVEDYWQTLMWYNNELMKDDYIMGGCLFVTGAPGDWKTFEHLGPILDQLAEFQQEITNDYDPSNPAPLSKPSTDADAESDSVTSTSTPVINFNTTSNLNLQPASQPTSEAISDPTSSSSDSSSEIKMTSSVTESSLQSASQWIYTLTKGTGLALLTGDIGIPNEQITVIKPDGNQEMLNSGSKAEHGPGGFEMYANQAGTYIIEFLDQRFEIPLDGQFTKLVFQQKVLAGSVNVNLSLRDNKQQYSVGEKVFVKMEITNLTNQPIAFGVLGLLTNTGHFQTSWDEDSIAAKAIFKHEDGLAFSEAGTYTIRLSLCFSPKANCLGPEGDWERFEPGVTVTVIA